MWGCPLVQIHDGSGQIIAGAATRGSQSYARSVTSSPHRIHRPGPGSHDATAMKEKVDRRQ